MSKQERDWEEFFTSLTPEQTARFWHNFAVNTGNRFPALREQFPGLYPTVKVDIYTGEARP